MTPGDYGYHCGFDTLGGSGFGTADGAENVLLEGWEGGLDVLRVQKDHTDVIGRLDGLRGGVMHAKILPAPSRDDPLAAFRPLVAVIIHGPALQISDDHFDGRSEADSTPSEVPVDSPSRPGSAAGFDSLSSITHYQTTVEVYSLRERKHLSTLFSSQKVRISGSTRSPLFSPPPPIAALTVDANGSFITVASGTSGEVFLFGMRHLDAPNWDQPIGSFHCLGKIWTATTPSTRGSFSGASSGSESGSQAGDQSLETSQAGTPLLSLSHRWLAFVPPSPSSTSISGKAFTIPEHKVPGLSSHTAPQLPNVTCAVDTPDAESLLNRVAREVTQEVIKGAKWVGDQGLQALRNYWYRPSVGNAQGGGFGGGFSGISQMRDQQYQQQQQQQLPPSHFPPTHAHNNQTLPSSSPTLVSVIDLEKLACGLTGSGNAAIHPMSTFQAPMGCSFLSLSPNGLTLLTASTRGDVQFVWDLKCIANGKLGTVSSSTTLNPFGETRRSIPLGPHVRQVARFTRMTVASIVDVAWSAPSGDRLAIVTEKGTVHVFDLPARAFQWPPPRRVAKSATATAASNVEGSEETGSSFASGATSAVSAAVNVVSKGTYDAMAAARRRRRSSGANLTMGLGMTSQNGQSGKAITAGFSKSLGAATGTVNSLRNGGDNKIHLTVGASGVFPGCVKWLSGREKGLIGVAGGGILRVYGAATKSNRSRNSAKRLSWAGGNAVEFPLPPLPDEPFAQAVLDGRLFGEEKTEALDGFWALHPATTNDTEGNLHPLSYAEIETNPPYQPFHTDRRISLFVFTSPSPEADLWGASPTASQDFSDNEPWVFGEPIGATKLTINPIPEPEEETDDGDVELGRQMENVLSLGKDDEEVEQVVVTTRRRKKVQSSDGLQDEDGFFEDDCEVLDFASDRI
jgi:hypothetical protein